MKHIRHPCNVLALMAILLLVVGVYRKSSEVDDPGWGRELPVSAATTRTPHARRTNAPLTATRPASALQAQPSTEAWSGAIDTILRDNNDVAEKSRRMVQLFPHLPPALQPEAAQHLVNFATDESPEAVLEPLLSENSNADAQSVLLLGLLQRTDKIRLPGLLKVARNPNHPSSPEALQYLQFLLESDHGLDWAQWEQAIAARLKPSRG